MDAGHHIQISLLVLMIMHAFLSATLFSIGQQLLKMISGQYVRLNTSAFAPYHYHLEMIEGIIPKSSQI